ncbi:MAG: ATP-binding protein, partial [Spirochaetaceae bacterium]|nr:ATP-binding protein [Spirochaetaceae bacterium]
MADLFTETGSEGGFRLDRLELFNWGGFNTKVWRLQPGCRNSLITGANGSGKTTVVDALVSLLVPPRNRHFNQSSGNDRRRDRTEESYVRGAYGTTRDESSLSSRVRFHRPDKKSTVSVLVAAFTNSLTPEPTCLAQVRWFGGSTGRLETRYILSRESLTIAEDFSDVDPRGEYLRRLKKAKNIEVFDTFTAYAKAFRLRFGMRSEKALTLFNKTVGVKDIDDLNDFIRGQMLDGVETEDEFSRLKAHYDDLLKAHRQIELAEERIKLLEDVERHGTEFRNRLDDYTRAQEAL